MNFSTGDLFYQFASATGAHENLTNGAQILRGFALSIDDQLLAAIHAISVEAPFRHLITPGGHIMSVAMTNCGPLGWISDSAGYRYANCDPQTSKGWPTLPETFLHLAQNAARTAGYSDFAPDACLINRYKPGSRLTLHQDKDELNMDAPIVSVSLGLPARFLFGGATRKQSPQRYPLYHGDVVVWGGASRLAYHGIAPLANGIHEKTGALRFNLTFRQVHSVNEC